MTRFAVRPLSVAVDAALRPYMMSFAGATLELRPSGALWWSAQRLLCVADLHLGKSERLARRGGPLLPPYETGETLARLAQEIAALDPAIVVSLGDAFDDPAAAAALSDADRAALSALMRDRRWIWIAGNHDPRPTDLPGETAVTAEIEGLRLRHVAALEPVAPTVGEVSAHFHPKATLALRGRRVSRRAFLSGRGRLILPAFGAYVGGLDVSDPAFDALVGPDARAYLCGAQIVVAPRRASVGR